MKYFEICPLENQVLANVKIHFCKHLMIFDINLQVPNTLGPEEEERVTSIIASLRDVVQKKRLMIYPYFRDFDRVCFC